MEDSRTGRLEKVLVIPRHPRVDSFRRALAQASLLWFGIIPLAYLS